MSKKLVLFGAGKIGRAFVGQLFSRAGYEVVFLDIKQELVDLLDQNGQYRILIKGDGSDAEILVKSIRALYSECSDIVANEIASADVLATAVGKRSLPDVAGVLAYGLRERARKSPQNPLDVIMAENLKDASQFMKQELMRHLPDSFDVDKYVGLIETNIGKTVPEVSRELLKDDPLVLVTEPYNTLILDKMGFKNPIPDVEGLAPKENIKAWVDRKLFIQNLGHAATAYYGYAKYPNLKFIHEVIVKKEVYDAVRGAMEQAAEALLKRYPEEFKKDELMMHITDLLQRFANKAIGDMIYRVGQDLYRKLGPEDRLVGALKLAVDYNLPYDKILQIIVCALNFEATDENGNRSEPDIEFSKKATKGIAHILGSVCGIDQEKHPKIHETAKSIKI